MITNLTISEHNVQAHTDIEHDIQKQKNGLFTFVLRVDNGNIVDYNKYEHAGLREYLVLKKVIVQEFVIPHNPPNGNKQNPIRTDNGQRESP